MIAAIPGDYSHVPGWVWILFTIVVVAVAIVGAYLVMRGITQGEDAERWIDEEDEESAPDVWKNFYPAEKSYEKHPLADPKPMSLLDWVFRQQ